MVEYLCAFQFIHTIPPTPPPLTHTPSMYLSIQFYGLLIDSCIKFYSLSRILLRKNDYMFVYLYYLFSVVSLSSMFLEAVAIVADYHPPLSLEV